MKRLLFVVVVLSGGCSKYAPKPLQPSALFEELRRAPITQPADGMSPDDAVSIALRSNVELRAFRRLRNVAESRVVSASAWENPELRLDLQAPLRVGFGVRVYVPAPGERHAKIEGAKAGERRVLAEIEDHENRVAAEALIAHAHLLAIEDELAIVEASIALHQRILTVIEQRLAVFAATELDRALSTLQRLQVEAERDTLAWQREEAQATLARACGLPVGSIEHVRRALLPPPLPPADPAALELAALRRRPDLRALEEAYQEREHQLELVHVEQQLWPRFFQPGVKKIPDKITADVSVALPIPIFSAKGPVGEAEGQRDLARATYVARLEASRAEVRAAWAHVVSGERRRQAYRKSVAPALAAAEKLTEATLASGDLDAVKLELIEARILGARRLAARADFEYERARVLLDLATGAVLEGKARHPTSP